MKRILFLLTFFAMSLRYLSAQECPLCGDWQGSYYGYYVDNRNEKNQEYGNIKIIIRIKRNGDSFIVRKKTIYPDGRAVYDDNHTVQYNPDKPDLIIWSHLFDTDYEKGMKWGSYYDKINYFDAGQVTLDGGLLNHKWWTQLEYYHSTTFINEYGMEETTWLNIGYEKAVEKDLILGGGSIN